MAEKSHDNSENRGNKKFRWQWLFLGIVVAIYLVVLPFSSEKVLNAVIMDYNIALQMILPLSIAFILMIFINLFFGTKKIVKLMGKGIGIRGIIFSSAAGMISMGPIYAWYPMLKVLREKGVPIFYLSNFLGNRAIKPFLLPVMILFFGWTYTITFNCLVWSSSITVSYILSIHCPDTARPINR